MIIYEFFVEDLESSSLFFTERLLAKGAAEASERSYLKDLNPVTGDEDFTLFWMPIDEYDPDGPGRLWFQYKADIPKRTAYIVRSVEICETADVWEK